VYPANRWIGIWGKVLGLLSIAGIPIVLMSCASYFLLLERPRMDRECPSKLWVRLHRQGLEEGRTIAITKAEFQHPVRAKLEDSPLQ
jgi:hypothetical protein